MKIVLIGAHGQVGWELSRTLQPLGEVSVLDYPEIDLAQPDQITNCLKTIQPDLIVNAAAYTAVDKAEEEPEQAFAINGRAPGILAEEARKRGALIVHYSTDYVFDGEKGAPYQEEDSPHPLNVYGKTKLAGDTAIQESGTPYLIFRTSWVFGARGKNFMLTILKLAREKEEIRIVDDQIGSPTWSRLIAEATAQILSQGMKKNLREFFEEKGGLYNLSAGGETSWFRFARAIIENSSLKDTVSPQNTVSLKDTVSQIDTIFPQNNFLPKDNTSPKDTQKPARLTPIPSSEYKTLAMRPNYSVLSNEAVKKAFGISIPSWEKTLPLVLEELTLTRENV